MAEQGSQKKTNHLDMLLNMGREKGIGESGESKAVEIAANNVETAPQTEKKAVGQGRSSKPAKKTATSPNPAESAEVKPALKGLNSLNLQKFPWMNASPDVITPLIAEIPQDLKMFLDGIARAIPGESMKSILVALLKRDLPEIAEELGLPVPESLKSQPE